MYIKLEVALIHYQKLPKYLRGYGLIINPYNPLLANKWTEGVKLTVVWHLDDMKVSHKSEKEVMNLIGYMKGIYDNNMLVVRGEQHTCVGMDLDYRKTGEVILSIDRYTTESIEEISERIILKRNHRQETTFSRSEICAKI